MTRFFPSYTRRRFGGRQPLCGIGVTSRIDFTSSPTVCSARIADSRPEPGPLTRTSSERMPTPFAALPALSAACVAANGVPLRDPLKPMPPALDQATTLPSVSVMVTTVLLKEAWMCASPWCTIRFSPRFLNVFLGRPALPSFFSGVAPSGAAASLFAMIPSGPADAGLPSSPQPSALHGFLLGDRALARALAGARVGAGPLTAYRQSAAVPHPAVAANLHQPLDVHRDFLAEVAFDTALLLDDATDLADVVFRQILDAEGGAHAGILQDGVRAHPPDPVDVGESDLDPLGARQIHACDTCHNLSLTLSLSLLVLLIRTDHPHHAAAADDLALVANLLHRCSNLHRSTF